MLMVSHKKEGSNYCYHENHQKATIWAVRKYNRIKPLQLLCHVSCRGYTHKKQSSCHNRNSSKLVKFSLDKCYHWAAALIIQATVSFSLLGYRKSKIIFPKECNVLLRTGQMSDILRSWSGILWCTVEMSVKTLLEFRHDLMTFFPHVFLQYVRTDVDLDGQGYQK